MSQTDDHATNSGALPVQAADAAPANRLISKTASASILIASIVTALATLLTTVIAARLLSVADNAEFLVFWSILFGIFGIVAGILNEATRTVSSARFEPLRGATGISDQVKRPRVISGSAIMGISVGVIVAATSPLWVAAMLPHSSLGIGLAIAMSTALYAIHITLAGSLAGARAWKTYALLSAAEGIVRLLLVLLAGSAWHNLLPLQIAVMLPTLLWVVFLSSSTARDALFSRADVPLKELLRNMLFAMGSAAASAVLITGYPAMLKVIAGHGLAPQILASMILAITLTRSPMMLPLQAFQGVAIAAFVNSPRGTLRPLVKPMALLAGLGVVGSILAALLGPFLVRLIYGNAYQIAPITFGALLFAAIALAWLTLTGTAAIAVSAHTAYLVGWVCAAVVSLLLLFLPLPILATVFTSLLVGPLCGAAVHLLAIKRA